MRIGYPCLLEKRITYNLSLQQRSASRGMSLLSKMVFLETDSN